METMSSKLSSYQVWDKLLQAITICAVEMKLALLLLANSAMGQDIFLAKLGASRDGEVHAPLAEPASSFAEMVIAVKGQDEELGIMAAENETEATEDGPSEPITISDAQPNLSVSFDPCDDKTWKYDADRQAIAKKRLKAGLPKNYDADAFENELSDLIVDKHKQDMTAALTDFILQLSKQRKPTKGADSGLTAALVSWFLLLAPEVAPIVNFIKNSKATADAVIAMLQEPGKGIKAHTAGSYLDYAININDNLAHTVDQMKAKAIDARNAFAKELKSTKDSKKRLAIRKRHYDAVTELLKRQQSLRQLRNVMFSSFLQSANTVFKRWDKGVAIGARCPANKYDTYNLCTNGAVDDESALLKQLFVWNPTCFNGLGLSEKCGSWSSWLGPGRCIKTRKVEKSCSKVHITKGYPTSYLRKCDDF